MPVFRRTICIITASGMVTLCTLQYSMQDESRLLCSVSQEECARLREVVPYVKVYRYNPKHLCPKLNGYGDNGQRKVWSSGGSTHCTCHLTVLSTSVLECGVI